MFRFLWPRSDHYGCVASRMGLSIRLKHVASSAVGPGGMNSAHRSRGGVMLCNGEVPEDNGAEPKQAWKTRKHVAALRPCGEQFLPPPLGWLCYPIPHRNTNWLAQESLQSKQSLFRIQSLGQSSAEVDWLSRGRTLRNSSSHIYVLSFPADA